ncbi:hypothetical protein [Aureimonas sp. SK2]|uniref:hypothetical protein n=1 Tax=Aureimonas sp. SK2 TaxID=3015992 RepID=UPI00244377E9|nr:hypothetical protein [Aureimonas sp. SK2]
MSADLMPLSGRRALAALARASSFLFVLSRGNPAWDGQWTQPNPPAPLLDVEDVLDPFGYARPTIVDFVVPDLNGAIYDDDGGRYSISAEPTRYVRSRLSLPVGAFAGEPLREVGLFINPVIDPSVAPGAVIVPPAAVLSLGDLLHVRWDDRHVLQDGGHYARNFFERL